MAGCGGTGAGHAQGAPAPHPTTSASGAAGDSAASLDAAAQPALELVGHFVPAGFKSEPVASEYDWARDSGQRLSEALSGENVLQVACTGNGAVSFTLHSASGDTKKSIPCGQSSTVQFKGNLDAVIDGSPSNSGVVAWRVLGAV
jgi:hypothetical protein